MLTKEEIIDYLKIHYPDGSSEEICNTLGLSISAIRTIATRNSIHKSDAYLKVLHKELMRKKEEKYLASMPKITLTQLEKNIIVGSILGDGNLTFAKRSRNAYYREHFSIKQQEYRIWKMNNIHSLKFRIEKECHLKSPSHPIFTEYYNQFYINGIKTITKENIKLLDHPIGLACLYMDDGTLMLSANKGKNNINIYPTIGITTLCFSKEECQILIEHIFQTFNIRFKLSSYPGGKGWDIKIYGLNEIYKFMDMILPHCSEITSLRYKWDLKYALDTKKQELSEKFQGIYNINISSISNINNYSQEEESIICNMKKEGKTYREIADTIGRSYYGIGYKISQLKRSGKL